MTILTLFFFMSISGNSRYRSGLKTFNWVHDHVSCRSLQAKSEGGLRWTTRGIYLIFWGLDTSS